MCIGLAVYTKYNLELKYLTLFKESVNCNRPNVLLYVLDGFGGLVVSMLASGSRVRGFDFFRCEKILSMPFFGGEVK
jgi:hypothetical protein